MRLNYRTPPPRSRPVRPAAAWTSGRVRPRCAVTQFDRAVRAGADTATAGAAATTAGLASLFGDAVAVDAARGVGALDEHVHEFDLAVADLTGRARVRRVDLERFARALVRALRPDGMALVRLPASGPAGRLAHRLRATGSMDVRMLRDAVTAEGAEVIWAGEDIEGALWLYVVAARRRLSLVRGRPLDSPEAPD